MSINSQEEQASSLIPLFNQPHFQPNKFNI